MFCCCAAEETTMAEVASTAVLEEGNPFHQGKFSGAPGATVQAGLFAVDLRVKELKVSQLGVEVDVTDDSGLVVADITEGVIQKFNELNPTQALRNYDKILAADSVTEHAQIYKTMKAALAVQQELLRISVCRPSRFEVKITPPGELGLKLHYKNNSAGIHITAITDGGQLAKWNSANLDRQALPGDRIVALNGKEMRGLELIENIKKEQAAKQEMSLTVLRYEK